MDPDAVLDDLRDLLDGDSPKELSKEQVDKAKELFQQLDAWILVGGKLPEEWSNPPYVTRRGNPMGIVSLFSEEAIASKAECNCKGDCNH